MGHNEWNLPCGLKEPKAVFFFTPTLSIEYSLTLCPWKVSRPSSMCPFSPVTVDPRRKVSLSQRHCLCLPRRPPPAGLSQQYRFLTTWGCDLYVGDGRAGRGPEAVWGDLFRQVVRDMAITANAIRCLEESDHLSAEGPGSCEPEPCPGSPRGFVVVQ